MNITNSMKCLLYFVPGSTQRIYTRIYTLSEKDRALFFIFFFLGAQCVESGVSCTDCYWILLVLIEIPAVPVGTKCSRWRPPNNRRHFVLWNTQRQRPVLLPLHRQRKDNARCFCLCIGNLSP